MQHEREEISVRSSKRWIDMDAGCADTVAGRNRDELPKAALFTDRRPLLFGGMERLYGQCPRLAQARRASNICYDKFSSEKGTRPMEPTASANRKCRDERSPG